MVATLSRFGSEEPFFQIGYFHNLNSNWGRFDNKLKGLIFENSNDHRNNLTGLILSTSINCLQNSIMFTPLAPKAGPTGGDGFAAPPLIVILLIHLFLLPF